MNIVLYQPEIPYNTGNIGRSCVLTNTHLHLIKPLGFSLDEKQIRRSGLDYWHSVKLTIWESFEEFLASDPEMRLFYATTKTKQKYSDVRYQENDYIMFGPESRGIPEDILKQDPERCITIPMIPMGRSLNLSNSAVIILYEALRQVNFCFGE
ncbi:MAG: tRNA (cytidine(34)-2'-O)-methyltransferase [Fusobacterium necrophorum]|uniref:tRNA (cytidine(34)-2'-O)-methyltransferase n=1 Tax=Fusobacterium necrophorum TaxID=859 RepID=UPI00243234CA|nr:tRNA (cytidine(34)-2'-O)-methyltransferase [Fusobacterium necrophorum]MCF0162859.1 tRNA (cytidine(34)-2'-O)-methyltransferase [Fusobacterium necrophorum]MDK4502084.1 tRNA (cytidine(34)-2'-O)-methyltransferase [Fusobacterium necrophorum]